MVFGDDVSCGTFVVVLLSLVVGVVPAEGVVTSRQMKIRFRTLPYRATSMFSLEWNPKYCLRVRHDQAIKS